MATLLAYNPNPANCYPHPPNLSSSPCYALIPALPLSSGVTLRNAAIAYHTAGTLNPAGDNAVVVFHGNSQGSDVVGWWGHHLAPGAAFDSRRWFVFCAHVLGGCYGSEGPLSPVKDDLGGGVEGGHTEAQRIYGKDFPPTRFEDDARAQRLVLDTLGVTSVAAAVGASVGGMLALEFAVRHPAPYTRAHISVAAAPASTAWQIAWTQVQRNCVMLDPEFRGGDYYGHGRGPERGLMVMRQLVMMSCRSEASYERRFGKAPARGRVVGEGVDSGGVVDKPSGAAFAVQEYLDYQGVKFAARYDANCQLHVWDKAEVFDVARGRADPCREGGDETGGEERLRTALRNVPRTLVVSVSSDLLFPPPHQTRLARCLPEAELAVLDSPEGHDGLYVASAAAELDALMRSRMDKWYPLDPEAAS